MLWGGAMDRGLRSVVPYILSLAGLASLFTLSARAQPADAKLLTVERIYGSPSLSGNRTQGMKWAPDGKRISYLDRRNGALELWTIDAGTGERKVLVEADALDAVQQPERTQSVQSTGLGRVLPDSYFWSPGGESLLFAGRSGLVLLDLKTMGHKTLVSGPQEVEDPKFSPDGKWVSFVRSSNLWVVNVASGSIRALTTGGSEEILKGELDWVYPEELDATTAYWWSPGFLKIAYYEMDERPVTRYPIIDMSSPRRHSTRASRKRAKRIPSCGSGSCPFRAVKRKWMDTGAENRHLSRACRLAARQSPRRDPAHQPCAKSPRPALLRRFDMALRIPS